MFCALRIPLLTTAALILLSGAAHGDIHLPARSVKPSVDSTTEFLRVMRASPGNVLHGLAAFSKIPNDSERKQLERLGIRLLEPFQGYTYRARVDKKLEFGALGHLAFEVNLVALVPNDRIAPALLQEKFARYVIRPPGSKPVNYVLNADGSLNVTVRMHPDVAEASSRFLLHKHTRSFSRRTEQSWTAIVSGESLRDLATEDAVQWIGAGPLPFLPENDRTRAEINADAPQNFNLATGQPLGLSGKGVQIGVFDYGMDDGNADLAGRVVKRIARKAPHATHEAGIMAGSGVRSAGNDSRGAANGGTPYQWRGMAPRAGLIDADHANGVDPATYSDYIGAEGMDLSNHSYPISFDGDYSGDDADHDQLIRGDMLSGAVQVPARLQVTSAGNHGQSPLSGGSQVGYFSLTKQLKNALVVGNWDLTTKQVDETSSLGPAHDGRIKPDVVAPGRSVASSATEPDGGLKSTGYCSPAAPLPQCLGGTGTRANFYFLYRGTSMASAATTGSIALVLEQYATSYGFNIDQNPPLPSTLRGLMIHTARDQKSASPWLPANPDGAVQATEGPDFVTGWGIIDTQAAARTVADRQLLEDSMPANCHVTSYLFKVPPGAAGTIRITLSWDDVAGNLGEPATEPKLVNDLDLVLIDPNGTRHLPWQLDQTFVDLAGNAVGYDQLNCASPVQVQRKFMPTPTPETANDTLPGGAAPKAERGADHLNNVEVVDAPAMEGVWQAQVTGFKIPSGPQRYSLIGGSLTPVVIHPTSVCTLYPSICAAIHIRPNVCERFPKICANRISFPKRDLVRIKFADLTQKIILPVDKICLYAINCPGCSTTGLCSNYDLQMTSLGASLKLAVLSSQGRLVKRDLTAQHSKRLRFSSRRGEQYFIVLSPGQGTSVNTDYDVTLRLN